MVRMARVTAHAVGPRDAFAGIPRSADSRSSCWRSARMRFGRHGHAHGRAESTLLALAAWLGCVPVDHGDCAQQRRDHLARLRVALSGHGVRGLEVSGRHGQVLRERLREPRDADA